MKIKIADQYDTIIVEKYNGDTILKGSRLFCGCCGGQMGVMKVDLDLPFKSDVFMKSVDKKSFDPAPFGLLHHSCGHSMFTFKSGWGFSKLDEYLLETPDAEIILEEKKN